MGKILEWIENKEHLKIAVVDYVEAELDIINFSDEYWLKHWEVFKRNKDKKRITQREFNERLYNYLWIQKVSELIIILYLEDLKDVHPTIYEINRLLRRTKDQYSATFKAIKKLNELDIIYTEPLENSKRNEKRIFINKKIAKIMEFLEKYEQQIKVEVVHASRRKFNPIYDQDYIISDQRPLAGSIIHLDAKKPITVHLKIEKRD